MKTFRAFRVHEGVPGVLEDIMLGDLASDGVLIEARYSSVNYKDALAGTARGKILRRFPLVAGVDVAGTVVESDDARFAPGNEVLVTGCGLGESHNGGFAEFVRVPGDWIVPLPEGLSLFEAMALGTAGFTAALAIDRLEQNGLQAGQGPVIVTGASGGVGSIAVDLLAGQGYEVVAMSRKAEAEEYLHDLGASEVVGPGVVASETRPLEQARWAAAIDNVGGDVLAWLTRTVRPWGNIASIGLAGGQELQTTVMPFILRGVSLLGVTSANCPMVRRLKVWHRLVTDLKPQHLDRIVADTVSLDDLPALFEIVLSGRHQGRYVVQLR